jgi:hypothetical protein
MVYHSEFFIHIYKNAFLKHFAMFKKSVTKKRIKVRTLLIDTIQTVQMTKPLKKLSTLPKNFENLSSQILHRQDDKSSNSRNNS